MDTVFVIKEKNSNSYTPFWSQWQYLTVTEFKMWKDRWSDINFGWQFDWRLESLNW